VAITKAPPSTQVAQTYASVVQLSQSEGSACGCGDGFNLAPRQSWSQWSQSGGTEQKPDCPSTKPPSKPLPTPEVIESYCYRVGPRPDPLYLLLGDVDADSELELVNLTRNPAGEFGKDSIRLSFDGYDNARRAAVNLTDKHQSTSGNTTCADRRLVPLGLIANTFGVSEGLTDYADANNPIFSAELTRSPMQLPPTL